MLVKGATDSKVHGANMGLIWGRQDPSVPYVGPMSFAIWGVSVVISTKFKLNQMFGLTWYTLA